MRIFLILFVIALSSIIAFAVVGPNVALWLRQTPTSPPKTTDRNLQTTSRSVRAFRPEIHQSQQRDIEPPNQITHAEFVSIIFPAFGLDSRTLKTATMEDRIDTLESLGFAPTGGYQPGKTLTVKEASVVLARVASRLGRQVTSQAVGSQYVKPGQTSRPVEPPGFAFSEADEQPVSADELAAAIQQRTVEVEVQTTTTVTVETQTTLDLPIQKDKIEELKRILEERLVEYYNPPYVQPLSLTD